MIVVRKVLHWLSKWNWMLNAYTLAKIYPAVIQWHACNSWFLRESWLKPQFSVIIRLFFCCKWQTSWFILTTINFVQIFYKCRSQALLQFLTLIFWTYCFVNVFDLESASRCPNWQCWHWALLLLSYPGVEIILSQTTVLFAMAMFQNMMFDLLGPPNALPLFLCFKLLHFLTLERGPK